MEYDPIKKYLGRFFNRNRYLRILFYQLLDLLLLRAWYIRRELKRWKLSNPGPRKILDAGSGFGQYTYRLAKLSGDYTVKAVDVKEEQIEDCNNFISKNKVTKRVEFQVADLTTFKEENKYDLILSVDVMEHIEEDVLVFKNLCSSLVHGGMLLISTPSDQGGSDAHHDKDKSFIGEHVRNGYGTEEIEQKLIRAGFSAVEAKYSYGSPGKLSWKLSMKYPVWFLSISRFFIILIPLYYLVVYPICFLLNLMDVNGRHKTGTGLIVKAWK
jgi:2-polyprenyl-3-methyl-5-hydroxy-6-metoxy-1,4-benzoquinol methylase